MHSSLFTFRLISLGALFFAVLSCQPLQTTCPIIDMDNPSGTIEMKISDLLDDIAIIPLETRDDLLLSAGMSFIVTNNYILVTTRTALLQFDRNGKFIKVLANQGNGPNEYKNLFSSLIDEEREILYYRDYGDDKISRVNLKTGLFLEPLYPNVPRFYINAIDDEGNIYGFPGVSDSLLMAFKYSPDNKSTTYFKGIHPSFTGDAGQIMFKVNEQIFFLFFPHSDTLYRVEGDQMIPKYAIKMRDLVKANAYQGGMFLETTLSTTQGIVFQKGESQIHQDEYSISIFKYVRAYLFLDKNGALKSIRSITIDPIALTIDMENYIKIFNENPGNREAFKISPMPTVSGSGLWGHFAVEAYNMISLIHQAFEGNRLSSDQRKILEDIVNKIDEESNPILIIGKVK